MVRSFRSDRKPQIQYKIPYIFSDNVGFFAFEEFLVGGKNVIFLELGLVYYAVAAGIGQLRFWCQVGGLVGFLVQILHMGGISTIVFFT